ncbi:5-methyltetrahydropteroyltriglutamate--homocysteine S-methyltransferase [Arthrobacter roseus]|uniref:5-methyltetrahydropteroyltriglutamate-- homocysteine S-methyltransferase n=1 Tax=Arthrobacter roseus TaxID=136274 RepID=UPI0019636D21|nr:5-methyltetrahydropteroyltriglutamate--homocysteine S-methyltransferase [Arthrobacter roseus]MBM7848745.1 5-methyltetrahydropteroyltriglutamate--homocysteine methyltransferase [Arthrobacter roseus]
MSHEFPTATINGYPRIGRRRELKRAVEAYWDGTTDAPELHRVATQLRLDTYRHLVRRGLGPHDSSIPATFSYYDQVLDTAVALGAVPERFSDLFDDGTLGLDAYFTLARGDSKRAPLEMTKWFDSNYHYLVPEIGPATPFRLANRWIEDTFVEALESGFTTRPVLIGPVTFLLLSKACSSAPEGFDPLERLDDLLPLYGELLERLKTAGAQWVQLEEPALTADQRISPEELATVTTSVYTRLAACQQRPKLLVTTSYGSLGPLLPALAGTAIDALHLDIFKGGLPSTDDLAELGETVLVAGLVDGHNVWKADLSLGARRLARLEAVTRNLSVSTSTSLQHVPHDVEDESGLPPRLRTWLAFADQKVDETLTLARLVGNPHAIDQEINESDRILGERSTADGVRRTDVRARIAALAPADFTRSPYPLRQLVQTKALRLPLLPTTTIGSFPQTPAVRSARARVKNGRIALSAYTAIMKEEIRSVIELQDNLGLDVLVHGEPERNDMVQYFAENLDGFAVTEYGWVQSYGSRCTRPSILWGDVHRPTPITVEWTQYAQSLSTKPVKGMLTGPVTILAWSFVRDDQSLDETARQVALALRDEIADLEDVGTPIIQVDEPALRELLPLREVDRAEYLDWSVKAFRLATSGAGDRTQIHTHLCYSEFGQIIGAIDALDADVTSIEAARSRMEVVADLAAHGYGRGVGPGVYDIHSPRIPEAEEIASLLETAVQNLPERQLWVNPDCGLKTRGYAETTASLANLVEAVSQIRERMGASV